MFICLLNYLLFNERERTHELSFWIKYWVENVWSIDKYLVVFKSTSFQIFKNFQYQNFFKSSNFENIQQAVTLLLKILIRTFIWMVFIFLFLKPILISRVVRIETCLYILAFEEDEKHKIKLALLNSEQSLLAIVETMRTKSRKRIIESRIKHFQGSKTKIHIVSITPQARECSRFEKHGKT